MSNKGTDIESGFKNIDDTKADGLKHGAKPALNLLDLYEPEDKNRRSWNYPANDDRTINVESVLEAKRRRANGEGIRRPASEIMQLPVEAFKALTPAQLSQVDAETLPELSVGRLKMLTSEQLNGLLTCTYTRQQLRYPEYEESKSGKWPYFRSKSATNETVEVTLAGVVHFEPKQMAALTTEQLRGLQDGTLASFSAEQLAGLSPEQIAVLKPSQVKILGETGISSKLAQLALVQLRALTPEQLQVLEKSTRETIDWRLITPQGIQALSAREIKSNARRFSADQVSCLTLTQIKSIPADEIARLFSLHQIRGLTGEQINSMTPQQIRSFADVALSALSDKQIQSIIPSSMRSMSPECLKKLADERIDKLSPEQILALPGDLQSRLSLLAYMPYFDRGPRPASGELVEVKDYAKTEQWFYKDGISEYRIEFGQLWPRKLQSTLLNHTNPDKSSSSRTIYADGHAEMITKDTKGTTTLKSEYYPDGTVIDTNHSGTKKYHLPVDMVRKVIGNIRTEVNR